MTSTRQSIDKNSDPVDKEDWLYRVVVPSGYGDFPMILNQETGDWVFDISSFYNPVIKDENTTNPELPLDPHNDAISCCVKSVFEDKGYNPWVIFKKKNLVPHEYRQSVIEFPVKNLPAHGSAFYYKKAPGEFFSKEKTFLYSHVGIVNQQYKFPTKDEFLRIIEGVNKHFSFIPYYEE